MPPLVFAAKFNQGDAVEVCNTTGLGLNVRGGDAPAGPVIGRKYDGDRGIILEGPQTAALGGIVYTWWRIRWDATLVGWSAEGEPGGTDWLAKATVVGEPTITTSLVITPSKSEYYVGETISATFTITNRANVPVIFSVLTAGGRDPDNLVVDFTFEPNVFIESGNPHPYYGTLTLPAKTGNYHFFCAYKRLDGSWNPAIPTEGGATNILDITVTQPPPPPPPPTYTLTITTTVGGTTNPAPGSHPYGIGQKVDVTALPDVAGGYTFDHWELDTNNVGSANPFQVTMNDHHTLYAVFVPKGAKAMSKPVEGYIVGTNYRFDFDYLKDDPKIRGDLGYKGHRGLDVNKLGKISTELTPEEEDAIVGAPVLCPADGKIVFVKNDFDEQPSSTKGMAGKWIWIWHGDVVDLNGKLETSISTRYLHLNAIPDWIVNSWQWGKEVPIHKGDVIGYVGDTGAEKVGPHLHFEVWQGGSSQFISYGQMGSIGSGKDEYKNREKPYYNSLTDSGKQLVALNPLRFVDYTEKKRLQISTTSDCVDLAVVDPDGFTISKDVNDLPLSSWYSEIGFIEDGDVSVDVITIENQKQGDYSVTVIPEPGSLPTENYTLQVSSNGAMVVLAKDIPIGEIPAEPYVFSSKSLWYSISGTVRDKLGNAIPNVLVVAQDVFSEIDISLATSNNTGKYTMWVSPSTYNLIITPPAESGFAATVISNVEVTADVAIDIVLVPAETITFGGKVVDRDGNPVSSISVYLYSGDIWVYASTNETGRFSMFVSPGSYNLQLYGGFGLDIASLYKSSPLNLTEDTFITMTLQNRYLSGKVVDPEGKPVPNVSIFIRGSTSFDDFNGYFEKWTTSNSDGDFNVAVYTSSSISIRASPPPESPLAPVSITNVNVTEDASITIILPYAITFSGLIVDRDGSPVPYISVYLYSGDIWRWASTNETGRFSMFVSPGSYNLQLYGGFGLDIASLYKATALNITEDAFITITLQNRYFLGKAVDPEGHPVPNVSIFVRGSTTFDDFNGYFEKWTTTDSNGNFNITIYTSSNVVLRATPAAETPFAPISITNINATEDTLITVTFPRAIAFGGLVVDRDGSPVPYISVYLYSGDIWVYASTNETGLFSMFVSPGSYNLQLYGGFGLDIASLYKATALNITEDSFITITLQNRYLTGKVDCEGKPVPNVSIFIRGSTSFDDFNGYFEKWTTTDSNGNFKITIYTSSSVSLRATPPPESIYAPVSIGNIDVTDDKTVLIALSYKAGVLPIANFAWTPETPEVDQTVSFDASTSIPGSGIIIRHKWSFGDGTYAIGKVVTHSYASPGVYTVTLNVTNSKGLWDIEQKQIVVVEPPPGPKPPVASFTFSPANPRVDEGATLDASASFDPDGQIVSYIWNFGDGFTGEGEIATHSYSKEGNYKVTLTVVDNDGKSSSTSQTVTVVKPTTPTIQTSGLVAIAKSPVDLVIIDPDYLVISKEYSEIPGAVYKKEDLNGDGSPDVYVFIPERKIGHYLITVIPKPDADPTATYTLEVSSDGIAFLLAENVPISDIPTEPYFLYSTTFEAPPLPTYALTIISTVGGTTDPVLGAYSYTANSTVQVTAISQANYQFEYWELDGVNVGSANPYSVLMDKNHTLKAVFSLIPPPLSASISPLSASILVGQSVTFTSTVSGGYTPYSYQWYLNGAPVSGATSASWTFTPTTSGIYYIHLKVTDAKANTAQSDTARITVATVPVGGYSIPIQVQTKTEPIIPYIALIAILTTMFTKLRPKTKRKR